MPDPQITVGTNSYISHEDAAAYLSERLYTDAWDNATLVEQQTALIMATRAIDRLTLAGMPADDDQALAFPRTYRAQDGTDVDSDDVPQAVADATVEEALALLDRGNSERRRMQADGLTSFQIGTLQEVYATGGSGRALVPHGLISVEARELLRPFIAGSVRIV